MKIRLVLFLLIVNVCFNLFAELKVNIPHVATTDGWETWLIIENSGFDSDEVTLTLYENGVQLSSNSYNVLSGESKYVQINEGSCGKVVYSGTNISLKASYVHTFEKGIAEFKLDDNLYNEINYLMPQYLSDQLTWMGIALMNPGTVDASINLKAYDNTGNVLSEKVVKVVSNSQSVGLVENYFSGVDYKNIARIKAVSDNSICGINISGNGNSSLLFTKATGNFTDERTLNILHIATEFDYWDNKLIFDNTGTQDETVSINLYSKGLLVVDEEITIEASKNGVIDLNFYSDLNVDSGVVKNCPADLFVRLSYVFKETGASAEFVLDDEVSDELVYNFPGYAGDKISWKGIGLYNSSDSKAFAILKAYKNGEELGRESVSLDPHTKYVNTLINAFPYLDEKDINRVIVTSNTTLSGLNISGEDQLRYLFTKASTQIETRTFEEKLFSLPGAVVMKIGALSPFESSYQVDVTQLLDHENPEGDTFTQTLWLNHYDTTSPMVMYTGGYTLRSNRVVELSDLVYGNEIIMGHRFFTGSKPDNLDWQYLNIKQAAADNHRIVLLLRDLYKGKWINTGGSKGGMTMIFHRRFYPDDVDVTVPYVAPVLFDLPDERFEYFVNNTAGDETCRLKLRDYQRRMLNRREEMVPLLESYAITYNSPYSILNYDEAFEYMIMEYPVASWQYGTNECSSIPVSGASANNMILHLLNTVGFLYSDSDIEVYKPFYYQAVTEFGYYGFMPETFQDLLEYVPNPSWTTFAPQGIPLNYNPEVMQDIDNWIQEDGNNMIYIYGGNDPWTSCAVDIGTNTNALKFTQPGKNHGTRISDLTEKEQVYQALEEWLGITVNRKAPVRKLDNKERRRYLPTKINIQK